MEDYKARCNGDTLNPERLSHYRYSHIICSSLTTSGIASSMSIRKNGSPEGALKKQSEIILYMPVNDSTHLMHIIYID